MNYSKANITNNIKKQFGYRPTHGQNILIDMLSDFLIRHDRQSTFLLKGYAGTGKTTIVSALVNSLPDFNTGYVLLAPTGRAAKVLAAYSGKKAYTIHKKIYRLTTVSDGTVKITLQSNPHKNKLFIVDEASMIPANPPPGNFSMFSSHNLLDDLIQYVNNGKNCRLLLIGDSAQLPPVGLDISPALDSEYLKHSYSFNVLSYELDEVVRQSLDSGILANATNLRKKISDDNYDFPYFNIENFPDMISITGSELEEELNTAYCNKDHENTVIITRSNKRANLFNQEIRKRILFMEDEISTGDIMMVVKNNYYWLPQDSQAGFIANGDLIEIMRINKIRDLYGFRFADVTLRLVDYPDEKEIESRLILDTIMAESASLPHNEHSKLYEEIMKDYSEIPSRRKRLEKVKNNPYYNSLQVKFAYSLTCHKTQGGQWNTVFIDQGYLKEEMINKEYVRWLYTALTRATDKVFLINFQDRFFDQI